MFQSMDHPVDLSNIMAEVDNREWRTAHAHIHRTSTSYSPFGSYRTPVFRYIKYFTLNVKNHDKIIIET